MKVKTEIINGKTMTLYHATLSESDKNKTIEKLNKKGCNPVIKSNQSNILLDGRSPKKGYKMYYSIFI